MRLATFIVDNMNTILSNWEAFAATQLPAAESMTPLALRDHAKQILEAIVKDLSTPQTREAQADKSMGRAPRQIDAPETAAETHAVLRARSDFDINQLAAEYRALRASVLRLWLDACKPQQPDLEDLMRFNEAIDQALAESINFFNTQVDQARNLLLGMVGHDLRNPLQAIQLTSNYLSALNAGEDVSRAAARLINSGARMQALLDDLVIFNRNKLGLGFGIAPSEVDLAPLFEDELEQLRAAYPDREIELEVKGDMQGYWDGQRLQQLLANLVSNAIKHGAADRPVLVAANDEESHVRVEVTNVGPIIEQSALEGIFNPLTRGVSGDTKAAGEGLGLFITREIVLAHGGEIEARSTEEETVFSVQLPRRQEAECT